MAKETISRNEYLQLIGLKTLADINTRKNEEVAEAMRIILGEESPSYSSDVTWDTNTSIDQTLENMKITVEDKETDA